MLPPYGALAGEVYRQRPQFLVSFLARYSRKSIPNCAHGPEPGLNNIPFLFHKASFAKN
jgi:hypothetical protein